MFEPPVLAAPCLSNRLGGIVDQLCRVAAARAGRYRILAPLVLLVWPYLRRLATRFDRLAALLQAGPLRPRSPRARAAPRTDKSPSRRLPRDFGWLIQIAPEAAGYGSHLRHLLADPGMAALLEAAPQAGRILRPLCHMLGIGPCPDIPASLFPARQAPAAAAAQASPPATTAAEATLPRPQSGPPRPGSMLIIDEPGGGLVAPKPIPLIA